MKEIFNIISFMCFFYLFTMHIYYCNFLNKKKKVFSLLIYASIFGSSFSFVMFIGHLYSYSSEQAIHVLGPFLFNLFFLLNVLFKV